MSESCPFVPPLVSDNDIRWASHLLHLSPGAFHGKDGDDPRQAVFKSMEPMDIAACPGSGKTTLLVAKLAILSQKWHYRTRGICVLSHTNTARSEIETKLGNTAAGRRLLSYPHFVGTIHSFVNEFLARPWLRSRSYSVKIIDTEICERRRWCKLDRGTRVFLQKNGADESNIRIIDINFRLAKKNGAFPCGEHTPTYQRVQRACEEATREGYHCFDDMFIWAGELMDRMTVVVNAIRERFPLLFLDEAQDNKEDQSAVLHRIFMDEGSPVRRQRFGDANQAIFNFAGDKGAETDVFPGEKPMELPNSHRFGQQIADLADPLALVPHGLKGHGPKKKVLASGAQEGRHTIFLFDCANASKVLDAYGALLLETFSDQELREGSFWAVAQVHRPPDKEEQHKFPHHLGHYWPDYDPELSKQDPKPDSFVQYVLAGMAKAKMTGEASPAVEKIAEGILRLAGMADGGKTLHQRKHSHRYVLQLLVENSEARTCYDMILSRFILRTELPTKEMWNDDWRGIVKEVAETAARSPLVGPEVAEFLGWPNEPAAPALAAARKARDNIYRFANNGREVAVQVGSIHSVKGKTHTATLVLDTYWQDRKGRHNLELLSPWLRKQKAGGIDAGPQQRTRLKIHYVAMTRPTHLLCLAMQRSVFEKGDGRLDQEVMQELEQRGWQIKCV